MKRKFLTAILALNMTLAASVSYTYSVEAQQVTASGDTTIISTQSSTETSLNLNFSMPGGFYSKDFTLELNTGDPGAKIYYTLDGSDPNENSQLFTEPIKITKEIVDKNAGLSYIPTTPLEAPENVGLDKWKWKTPAGDIDKAVVVRAVAVGTDGKKSDITTQTYWVNEAGKKYTLPVVSIVTDKANFFDDKTGLYVPGDTYKQDPGWDESLWGNGNYKLKGDNWRKRIHIEFYDDNGKNVFSQDADTQIKGTASSSLPQKSLKLYLDKYGNDGAKAELFSDVKDINGETINNYKRVILRNAGQGFLFSYFQDALTQRLSKDLNIDTEGYRPAIVFINGEYWGIQNLRENYDKYYLQTHYGASTKKVDIIKSNAAETDGMEIEEGDKQAYTSLMDFIHNNDFKDASNYEKLGNIIDIDNFINYNVAEIYCENTDWPLNNVELWRSKNDYNPSASYGLDGRWRWMLHDTDDGFGSSKIYDHDSINQAKLSEIFAKLQENSSFKNDLINRMADALNTTFKSDRVLKTINDMQSVISPEMQQQIDRWGYPATTVDDWNKNVDMMKKFAKVRPDYVRQHFIKDFNLSGQANITVELPGSSQGSLQINTLTDDKLRSNNSTKTWQGIYFKDVPVTLKATPKTGYVFWHWEGIDNQEDKNRSTVNVVLQGDISIKPCFVQLVDKEIQKPEGAERTVKFKKPVDASTVNNSNIYVSTDEDGINKVEGVTVSVDENNNCCVKINPPQDGWKKGQTYHIFVRPEVKSAEGELLKKIIRCKFTISD